MRDDIFEQIDRIFEELRQTFDLSPAYAEAAEDQMRADREVELDYLFGEVGWER